MSKMNLFTQLLLLSFMASCAKRFEASKKNTDSSWDPSKYNTCADFHGAALDLENRNFYHGELVEASKLKKVISNEIGNIGNFSLLRIHWQIERAKADGKKIAAIGSGEYIAKSETEAQDKLDLSISCQDLKGETLSLKTNQAFKFSAADTLVTEKFFLDFEIKDQTATANLKIKSVDTPSELAVMDPDTENEVCTLVGKGGSITEKFYLADAGTLLQRNLVITSVESEENGSGSTKLILVLTYINKEARKIP